MDTNEEPSLMGLGVHPWFPIDQDNPLPLQFGSTEIEDEPDL
jgi:hypothetical protein